MVFLFWVYISAVILLYGVEMTAAYARPAEGRSPAHAVSKELHRLRPRLEPARDV